MKSLKSRKVLSVMVILFLSLLSEASYGQDQQENSRITSMIGYNVEVSATRSRDIVNVGLWMAEQGLLAHVGLFDIKPREEAGSYGVDFGLGYCDTSHRLWPFAEVGMKVGVGAGISNFNGALYPKIGIDVPLVSQLSIYVSYLYAFSTQGRHSDYSAASVGFVWAIL